MYQAWPWGGAPGAPSTTAGFVQPALAAGQVAAQWPAAGYNQQYAAMTPEMQQQWAAAWASQAQAQQAYAAYGAVPAPNTAVPYQTALPETPADSNNVQSSSEQPKTELSPKDSAELDKLKQLKEQAEKWKTLQQPTTAAAWNPAAAGVSVSSPSVATSGTEIASASQPNQAQLEQEEEEFERQFKDWEKQFEAWKEQNQGHPDKEAFSQYEKQWQEWRATLLQKQEQMQKAKEERLAAAAAAATNQVPASTAVDPNAALYYQQQYMQYMQSQQPYMYPGGMPGVPPAAAGGAQQQWGPEGYPNQQNAAAPEMQPPNSDRNAKDMNNFDQDQYGQSGEQFPPQNEYQNYDEYGNMYPPDMDQDQFQGGRGSRGRGARGRGRGRGRGGRWSDPSEGEGMPSDMRPGLLDNPGGDFPPDEFHGGPDGFPGGPNNFRGGPGDFHDGPGNFGRGPLRDGPDFNSGLPDDQGPPFDYPPENLGPEDGNRRRNFPNDDPFNNRGDGPPAKKPLLSNDGPSLLPPRNMNEGPPPQPSNRYPPDDFDEEFPGEPPFDDHFPPPHGDFDGGFPPGPMGDDFGGRPPFRGDNYPPFDRFPPGGRGRFPPRGRGRFGPGPHGDFDRFGPGGPPNFPPGEGPPFGPHDDRFPFPGDMPGRGGPRGHFGGPRGGGRFGGPPDDPFFHDGGGPMRYKSKDYTHRSAEDFDPHYEFEEDYQGDVMQFRAPKRKGNNKNNNKRPARGKAPPAEKKSSD